MIREFVVNFSIAVSLAIACENFLDEIANLMVGNLHERFLRGMIEAAAWHAEGTTNFSDTASSFSLNTENHIAALDWGLLLVPRITAAFFKLSFSSLRWATSRRNQSNSVRFSLLAYGSEASATVLLWLRGLNPSIKISRSDP
ncbi:MAG: hypothetical protein ACI9R3_005304 [Verrucomicrobiales bacterium]